MQTIIRKARQSDLTDIFKLVNELAIYEKAAGEVTATLDDYRQAFSDKVFEALVAEIDGQIVGMALYYMAYSTWKGKMLFLEDFIVSEVFRNKGAGQLLFEAFLDEARSKKVAMVKWQVLDWNEPAIAFYEKNRAIFDKGWWNVKMFCK